MWAISLFNPRAASHRSTLRCRFSQNSGELPNNFPSRSAISGVTARRSRSSSFTDCRDTPAASASAVNGQPVLWKEILAQYLARVNRPPFARARIGNAHARVLRLVIIAELNIVRIAILESKADTPLIVHGDRVLSGPISFERV